MFVFMFTMTSVNYSLILSHFSVELLASCRCTVRLWRLENCVKKLIKKKSVIFFFFTMRYFSLCKIDLNCVLIVSTVIEFKF